MPGDGLIPDYRARLQRSGAGISARAFLERVIWPLLSTLEISREEMKVALKKQAARVIQAPISQSAAPLRATSVAGEAHLIKH
jgi:hypothetical protein